MLTDADAYARDEVPVASALARAAVLLRGGQFDGAAGEYLMFEEVDLRQQAERYRRLASVPTTGGHNENRVLLAVADVLERRAAELEDRISETSLRN